MTKAYETIQECLGAASPFGTTGNPSSAATTLRHKHGFQRSVVTGTSGTTGHSAIPPSLQPD
ncbi:hypothetical protein E2C01_000403 [Portunus trituberculatus]|uniref:Uncharacterized protein n=1 Tax=Portunus trituberculatus TaxID=210409 RepID=A0A5B7CHC1_PORTR|nr:hypothetical protein [Portunus trituberculatus]